MNNKKMFHFSNTNAIMSSDCLFYLNYANLRNYCILVGENVDRNTKR